MYKGKPGISGTLIGNSGLSNNVSQLRPAHAGSYRHAETTGNGERAAVCTMSDKAITVIVPTYNHETLVSWAIESIVRQTIFDECHVVVSDDCSSDGTYDVARRYCDYHANVSVRRNTTNMGVMKHYQHLVSEIDTPFISILEGDDMWISARKLEAQRRFLELNPAVNMCFSACVVEFEATSTQVEHPAWNDGPQPADQRDRSPLRQSRCDLFKLLLSFRDSEGHHGVRLEGRLRLALLAADSQ